METEQEFQERIAKSTEAEVTQEFFDEYKKLSLKYKRCWIVKPVQPEIVKLELTIKS